MIITIMMYQQLFKIPENLTRAFHITRCITVLFIQCICYLQKQKAEQVAKTTVLV